MATRRLRTYHEVADPGAEDIVAQVNEQAARLARRLEAVRRVTVVASGKGGVGKSAITANLAAALALRGRRVGAADADLNGPSLARMLGAAGQRLRITEDGVEPATGAAGVRVMSMDLLLPGDDAPLRWRTPAAPEFLWQSTLEGGALREFLSDTRWGDLDHLLIDAPPGTDKLTRLLQLLPRADSVLLVTTPSEIARFMGGKAVRVALEVRREGAEDGMAHAESAEGGRSHAEGAEDMGIVMNMSGHVCEACGHQTRLFGDSDASAPVGSPDVPVWAEIPFDRRLALATDRGQPFVLVEPDAPAARALRELARRIDRQDAAGTAP